VAAGKQNSAVKRRIAAWARNIGLRSNFAAMRGSVLLSQLYMRYINSRFTY